MRQTFLSASAAFGFTALGWALTQMFGGGQAVETFCMIFLVAGFLMILLDEVIAFPIAFATVGGFLFKSSDPSWQLIGVFGSFAAILSPLGEMDVSARFRTRLSLWGYVILTAAFAGLSAWLSSAQSTLLIAVAGMLGLMTVVYLWYWPLRHKMSIDSDTQD